MCTSFACTFPRTPAYVHVCGCVWCVRTTSVRPCACACLGAEVRPFSTTWVHLQPKVGGPSTRGQDMHHALTNACLLLLLVPFDMCTSCRRAAAHRRAPVVGAQSINIIESDDTKQAEEQTGRGAQLSQTLASVFPLIGGTWCRSHTRRVDWVPSDPSKPTRASPTRPRLHSGYHGAVLDAETETGRRGGSGGCSSGKLCSWSHWALAEAPLEMAW